LDKRFGDVHAMNDITLDLKPGLFGLLGPNGAGKSTLMRTLATLQKPDEGTITYNGTDIVSKPDVMRSTLGYLPQDFGVYPRMSAEALLDHIAILKGVNDKKQRREQILSLLHSVSAIAFGAKRLIKTKWRVSKTNIKFSQRGCLWAAWLFRFYPIPSPKLVLKKQTQPSKMPISRIFIISFRRPACLVSF